MEKSKWREYFVAHEGGDMDIIDGYLNAAIGEHASILIDYKNQPAVIYAIDGKTFYRYLAGSVWLPRIELGDNLGWSRDAVLSDYWVTQTVINRGTVFRFTDYGKDAKKSSISPQIFRWDLEALENENVDRGIEWSWIYGTWKIYRIYINNPT